jgi:uncharacterized membrane protein YedE/YeeE
VSMTGYWPWWIGALVLATVTVAHQALLGRSLGVSGIYAQLLRWREERREDEARRALFERPDALRRALLQATERRFGTSVEASEEQAGAVEASPPSSSARLPGHIGATFLFFVFLGGVLSGLLGHTGVRLDLGSAFAGVVGSGWKAVLPLLGGGFLVGFGTRMAGGCTSGHGLSGCARFQPGSLVATAMFFGAAVVTSLLLGAS